MEAQIFILGTISSMVCTVSSLIFIFTVFFKSGRCERILSFIIALITGYLTYCFSNILNVLCP